MPSPTRPYARACAVLVAAAPLATATVLALATATFAPPASAADASRPERPPRGMRMADVEARYGAPSTKHAAIGQPPITRWDYPGLVVFFENDHVVHAVVTPASVPASS